MAEPLTIFLIVDNAPDAEDDCYALSGAVYAEGGQEVWRDQEGRWIPLDDDWRERRREVKAEVADILGPAPHFLPVVVRPLPGEDPEAAPLGWKLPQ